MSGRDTSNATIHFMSKPGVAWCGADYPNMSKTANYDHVTCLTCTGVPTWLRTGSDPARGRNAKAFPVSFYERAKWVNGTDRQALVQLQIRAWKDGLAGRENAAERDADNKIPVVRVEDLAWSGPGSGPYKLWVGDWGVAHWPCDHDPREYAEATATVLRSALAAPCASDVSPVDRIRSETDIFLAGYDAGRQKVDPNAALDRWKASPKARPAGDCLKSGDDGYTCALREAHGGECLPLYNGVPIGEKWGDNYRAFALANFGAAADASHKRRATSDAQPREHDVCAHDEADTLIMGVAAWWCRECGTASLEGVLYSPNRWSTGLAPRTGDAPSSFGVTLRDVATTFTREHLRELNEAATSTIKFRERLFELLGKVYNEGVVAGQHVGRRSEAAQPGCYVPGRISERPDALCVTGTPGCIARHEPRTAEAPPEPALRGRFTCRCGASHDRGPINGTDAYRCLKCGETTKVTEATPGYYHPDLATDCEIRIDVETGKAVDRLVARVTELETAIGVAAAMAVQCWLQGDLGEVDRAFGEGVWRRLQKAMGRPAEPVPRRERARPGEGYPSGGAHECRMCKTWCRFVILDLKDDTWLPGWCAAHGDSMLRPMENSVVTEVRRHEGDELSDGSRGVDRAPDSGVPARGGDARGVDVHRVAPAVTPNASAALSDAAAATQFLDDVFGSERAIEGDHAALVALLAGTRRETVEACAKRLEAVERKLVLDEDGKGGHIALYDDELKPLAEWLRDEMAGQFTSPAQEKK